MPRLFTIFLAIALATIPAFAAVTPGHKAMVLGTGGSPYGFVEFVPSNYLSAPSSTYPLVIFLHGAALRGPGTDPKALWIAGTTHGPSKLIKNGTTWFEDEKCIVLSPQSPVWWESEKIDAFITFALARYRIDTNRIYLTGVSMGGGGTWSYVATHGQRIAACMPIAGAAPAGAAARFRNVPTWAFHAWGDPTVPRTTSIDWCNNIAGVVRGGTPTNLLANYPATGAGKPAATPLTANFTAAEGWLWSAGSNGRDARIGKHPKLTLYTDALHDSWTRTYEDRAVWTWLFAQVRPRTSNG